MIVFIEKRSLLVLPVDRLGRTTLYLGRTGRVARAHLLIPPPPHILSGYAPVKSKYAYSLLTIDVFSDMHSRLYL